MAKPLDDYLDQLPHCMLLYQWIEEGLRFYLHRCHAIITLRLRGVLAYKPPYNIDKASLGTLVKSFSLFNEKTDLTSALDRIVSSRNKCAHGGYVLVVEDQRDDGCILARLHELQRARAEADQCLAALKDELKVIDGLFRDEVLKTHRTSQA